MAPTRWGDEPDEDESVSDQETSPTPTTPTGTSSKSGVLTIPPTTTRIIDSNKNIKLVTSYRPHPSNPTTQLLQLTTKIKFTKETVKEPKAIEVRRKWKKFGQAALSEDDRNVTIQSRDDVFVEDPKADQDMQEEDVGKALAGNLNEFWAKQKRRQLERKYDVDGSGGGGAGGPPAEESKEDGWTKVGAERTGKYVPPSARAAGGTAMGGKSLAAMAESSGAGNPNRPPGPTGDRDQNTIRVTNISEDTTEADLQDLFQPFGRISRVYLAKDKETLQSRGFAFVSFVHRDDAAKAMEKLQGFGYDHLILKLEWARPSAPRDPGSEGTQFRSGYGKALAQDTKEKVSFASNLTRGVR